MVFPVLVHPGYNSVFFNLQLPEQKEENGHQIRLSLPRNV